MRPNEKNAALKNLGDYLLREHGPQGWWPLLRLPGHYHVGDYDFPKTDADRFEIGVGSILTQNTSWIQVTRALDELESQHLLSPAAMRLASDDVIIPCIHAAGYYNQKAKKLKAFAEFFIELEGRTPTRDDLLSVWGIGPETADSMLLYAWSIPSFVVDAYTRRIGEHLGLFSKGMGYHEIKSRFEEALQSDNRNVVHVYQEYHALIVEHAKCFYRQRPYPKKSSYPIF